MGDDGISIDSNGNAVRMLREALPGVVISQGKIETILEDWALNKLKERERKKLDKEFEAGGARPWREVRAEIEAARAA